MGNQRHRPGARGLSRAAGLELRPHGGERRLRTHARQAYAFLMAGRLGWNGPWQDIVADGTRCLIDRYRRPDGLFRRAVHADGSAADETPTLYEQAFTPFVLTHLAQDSASPDAKNFANALLAGWRPHAACPAASLNSTTSRTRPTHTCTCLKLCWPGATWMALCDAKARRCGTSLYDKGISFIDTNRASTPIAAWHPTSCAATARHPMPSRGSGNRPSGCARRSRSAAPTPSRTLWRVGQAAAAVARMWTFRWPVSGTSAWMRQARF